MGETSISTETQDQDPGSTSSATAEEPPQRDPSSIGRYRVIGRLGQGGFGRVYLAHDDDLNRQVAIKVPHPERVLGPEDIEAYLAEARTLARLDHPNIVPVYDVGRTSDGLCYVVSKCIEGSDLAAKMRKARFSFLESAELVAVVAEAIHYAHTRKLVHRDIKPANILIDTAGKPCVADFGLALSDEDFGTGARRAGTPAYMSPEQARGEGHRVDGRSDIFSLGVVCYELLTGRKPFVGNTHSEVMEQIATAEPRPLRQIDDRIPRELERICLKALAKSTAERYTTAREMAEDLQVYLKTDQGVPTLSGSTASGLATSPLASTQEATISPGPSDRSDWGRPSITVVPKGLRSFDAHDADFFLELLSGPRDRDGLPESLRFWKSRIESTDPDTTFKVGLIYGPSGCGKSSMVKAGLLPRLGKHVLPVYLEATATETEAKLLRGLRKVCPGLPGGEGLVETVAALRRRRVMRSGQKVLLILDQFEQWLFARPSGTQGALVAALRQCDGEHVQAIVMVRDDFWLATSRFMRDLEIDLEGNANTALVDLFDLPHARKVLTAFGRAYGKWPERGRAETREEESFLNQAITSLAQHGKVVPVRLALFAEMIKGKPWTVATLRALGGVEGVGVAFLEEAFGSTQANPRYHLHQEGAQAVLKALLPSSAADIKGQVRSETELRAASGDANRPRDFADLIRILDSELRLITPSDPECSGSSSTSAGRPTDSQPGGERCYQLTHDYLVPSLRDWLTRKQCESRRGRLELRLAERASLWGVRRERRQLPSLAEWLAILAFTASRTWTDPQRDMMRSASRYHLAWASIALAIFATVGVMILAIRGRLLEESRAAHSHGLVLRLLDASTPQVPAIVREFQGYRRWTDPLLRETLADPAGTPGGKLRARLALLEMDGLQVNPLCDSLLEADPETFRVLRDSLQPSRAKLVGRLWDELGSPDRDLQRRFQAAAALASYDAGDRRWERNSTFVADRLIAQPSLLVPKWVDALRPIRDWLIPPLSAFFRDRSQSQSQSQGAATRRALVAAILADYDHDRPEALADLLGDAEPGDFGTLFTRLQPHAERAASALEAILKGGPASGPSGSLDSMAKRRANAAIALLRMGRGDRLWPLLEAAPDPRLRCFLIDRLAPAGVDPATLAERLRSQPVDSIRAALLVALGGYGEPALPLTERAKLEPAILDIYRADPDPAVHAAAGWLLQTWGLRARLREVDTQAAGQTEGQRRWYVNGLGQTMVIIPGPVDYPMGSSVGEAWRKLFEAQHQVRIPQSYDLSATEVTVAQFQPFLDQAPELAILTKLSREAGADPDTPQDYVNWYVAAKYCNWLSQVEGIPTDQWCFEPNGNGKFADGMKVAPNYQTRIGYRLPTEPEWEYACRGGTITSRYFGESDELMTRYAWCILNSEDRKFPVGTLRPNAFGFFDMYGNVFELCLDASRDNVEGVSIGVGSSVQTSDYRFTRGGSFVSSSRQLRSAARFMDKPNFLDIAGGFRIARSRPPAPATGPNP